MTGHGGQIVPEAVIVQVGSDDTSRAVLWCGDIQPNHKRIAFVLLETILAPSHRRAQKQQSQRQDQQLTRNHGQTLQGDDLPFRRARQHSIILIEAPRGTSRADAVIYVCGWHHGLFSAYPRQ